MNLIELATVYRTLNLYAHHAHNMASGDEFMQDHAFFGEVYSLADSFYDDVVERHIGTTEEPIDLCGILKDSYDLIEKMNDSYYKNILILLKEIVSSIDSMKTGMSSGTVNLIQGQADQTEVLIYKIKRRIK